MSKKVVDHLNKEFNSVKEMCDHWGITLRQYYWRLNHGWSLKDILTKSLAVVDHEGNKWENTSDMCLYWGVKLSTFKYRIKHGWSLKNALEFDKYH